MPTYSNAIIYKMTSPDDYFYYGSTCCPLRKRKHDHKEMSKLETKNKTKVYKHINDNNIDWKLIKLEEVEKCPEATCLVDVTRIEDKWIRENIDNPKCLNTIGSYRSEQDKNDYHAKWYEKNKETEQQKQKEYKDANREKINEDNMKRYEANKEKYNKARNEANKVLVECPNCHSMIRKDNLSKHKKTNKCKSYSSTASVDGSSSTASSTSSLSAM